MTTKALVRMLHQHKAKRINQNNDDGADRSARLGEPTTSRPTAMDKTASPDPSYCCFTVFAICITLFSAGATFLIANHMYTGMPCHDEPQTDIPPQMQSFGSDRLFLPEKRVVVIKLAGLRRCYILPAKSKDLSVKNFRVVEESLGKPLLRHLSSDDAAKMCEGMNTFLLTEQN